MVLLSAGRVEELSQRQQRQRQGMVVLVAGVVFEDEGFGGAERVVFGAAIAVERRLVFSVFVARE
jgi:hypothetical protein